MNVMLVTLLLFQTTATILENDYLATHRNTAPCALAESQCGDRVIVALDTIRFEGSEMERGVVRIFNANESYSRPQGGDFVEVALKFERPAVRTDTEAIVPEHYNVTLYEGERFRVIEGRLWPGDIRNRHTHNQRLVIYLNATRLRQLSEGEPERFIDFIADNIGFSEPTIHALENIGNELVRNIVIELKP